MNAFIETDRRLIRAAGGSVRYVLVSFIAPEAMRAERRPPVNVSLVLDRSGSMGSQKIALARTAVVHALRLLRSSDRFSIVAYDDSVDVIVPSTPATTEAVANAIERVNALRARGQTDLGGGWLKGCEQIAEHLDRTLVNRCLLVTDGLANAGIVDHTELVGHADALRERGISTSTFGVGADFDERLLEAMSRAGAGHFYFVETAVQIPDYFTSELGEALEVVARDAAISVRTSPAIAVTTLNSLRASQEPEGCVVHLGDLTSRQEVSVVFRLKFPGADAATASAAFAVSDAGQVLDATEGDVHWTFADHASNDRQPRNVAVDRAVARLYAARAQADALELNRAGDYDRARAVLSATGRRIAKYAGTDGQILAIADELEQKDASYGVAMSAIASKSEYFGHRNVSAMRSREGRAVRRPRE